ncbi:TPA: hypothetical protein RQK84_004265 [Vibrio vulnificus]|uniref:Uncharacterized protein n=1 Tax=Vibrio rotiferianus TaxID=190895 RepID=A0ABX3D5A0_9VIBR|nr:hypothetical protein [Vibrio rotiferianus]HAS8420793.1 hypothetical protein [Vibrio vulnificus]OHY90555.1 hypothetical protein BI375_23065 [Vibrio rotiferianus]HAS8561164.1 hypothetical protein [Vibrio vulnificus]HAT8493093.1 hypothetical protein [Vibrio vulnificus]HDY8016149.1 hypothetical protein [Vibrio vulnificus]
MPDIVTISTALSSIKTAAEIAKLIKDGEKSLEQAEFKLKLADLVSSLADAKMEMANIQELILEKDRLISELKNQLEKREQMIWDAPYYWQDKGNERDGPFCQQCFDNEHKAIRLIGHQGVWNCNTCKNVVTDDTYESYHGVEY